MGNTSGHSEHSHTLIVIINQMLFFQEKIPLGHDGNGSTNKQLLPILQFEKTLLDTTRPVLKSQCESILLRNSTLLRLDKVLQNNSNELSNDNDTLEKQNFFVSSWTIICEILSSALYRRPSYLVKSRVPLVVAIFRNLLFGLTNVANQNLYDVTKTKKRSLSTLQVIGLSNVQELETMSHNLDRCLDLIRGDKLKEDFARVAPYMIADMLEAGFSGKVTVIQTVKSNLLSGMYKVITTKLRNRIYMNIQKLKIKETGIKINSNIK